MKSNFNTDTSSSNISMYDFNHKKRSRQTFENNTSTHLSVQKKPLIVQTSGEYHLYSQEQVQFFINQSYKYLLVHQINQAIDIARYHIHDYHLLRKKAYEMNQNTHFIQRNLFKTSKCQLLDKFDFCPYGTQCDWYHHLAEKRQPICIYHVFGQTCRQASCKYSHDVNTERIPIPELPSTNLVQIPIYKRVMIRPKFVMDDNRSSCSTLHNSTEQQQVTSMLKTMIRDYCCKQDTHQE